MESLNGFSHPLIDHDLHLADDEIASHHAQPSATKDPDSEAPVSSDPEQGRSEAVQAPTDARIGTQSRAMTSEPPKKLQKKVLFNVRATDMATLEVTTKVAVLRMQERISELGEVLLLRPDAHRQASSNTLGPLVCRAMLEVMGRQQDPLRGVWYPDELKEVWSRHGMQMPDDYLTGHIDERFFTKSRETGTTTFTIQPGIKPSEGLAQFFRGPTVATCGMTVFACAYHALIERYGADRFDQLFSDANPFMIEEEISEELFDCPEPRNEGSFGNRPLNVGDVCWFESVPWYLDKHPGGYGAGQYVVYNGRNESGQQIFIGLGLERPSTEQEIIQWLIEDYNQPRSAVDEMLIEQAKDKTRYCPDTHPFLRAIPALDASDPKALDQYGFVRFVPQCTFRLKELT